MAIQYSSGRRHKRDRFHYQKMAEYRKKYYRVCVICLKEFSSHDECKTHKNLEHSY